MIWKILLNICTKLNLYQTLVISFRDLSSEEILYPRLKKELVIINYMFKKKNFYIEVAFKEERLSNTCAPNAFEVHGIRQGYHEKSRAEERSQEIRYYSYLYVCNRSIHILLLPRI